MKKKSIKKALISLSLLTLSLSSCSLGNIISNKTQVEANNNTYTFNDIEITSASDASSNEINITNAFSISTEDGQYDVSDNIYTITTAGTYVLSGLLSEGQIRVTATEDDKVKLVLNNCKITNSNKSPIYIDSASKVIINTEDSSYNEIIDNRSSQTSYQEDTGNAAIYSLVDLGVSGYGSLVVYGYYNNGIDTNDDLSIKNVTLKVEAYNNSLKGNDSVEIESGEIIAVSTAGDAIKTSSSNISSKGNQQGNVLISGGNIMLYAADNGIDSSYDVIINEDSTNDTSLSIYTASYSKYTKVLGQSLSGIKAANVITIDEGEISISTKADGLHANRGDALENGGTGLGNVVVNGGTCYIKATDDGIHADYITKITGGTLNILTSEEGIEGSQIEVSGGYTMVNATDDGLNANGKYLQGLITVSGGVLDVTVSSGDTDGIDVNGSYKQIAGLVVSRNPNSDNSGNMAAIDADSSISVTGGTFISVGSTANTPTGTNVVIFGQASQGFGSFGGRGGSSTTNSKSFTSGTYSVLDSNGNEIASFELDKTYNGMWIASSNFQTNETYTISNGQTTYTWQQTSSKVTVS